MYVPPVLGSSDVVHSSWFVDVFLWSMNEAIGWKTSWERN